MNQLAKKMADSYREKLAEAGLARCKICGKYFRPWKSTQKCCSRECSERNCRQIVRGHQMRKKKPPTIKCCRCGKEVPNGSGKKYCKECAVEANREKARARYAEMRQLTALSRMPVNTAPDMITPAAVLITKEPDKPARARLKIPVNRLPKPPRPATRNRANEPKTEEEIRKAIAEAEFAKTACMW